MNLNLVCWNYRGLGNPTKAEAIKDFMKMEPIDVLMLQETKIEGETLLNTNNTKWKFDSRKVISARGSAGGIGTFWSKNLFTLGRLHETQHWIYTELWHTAGKVKLDLFNMYVPVHYEEKKECWKTLSDYIEQCSPTNIIIGGDLNIILDPKEKRGGSSTRDPFLPIVENSHGTWLTLGRLGKRYLRLPKLCVGAKNEEHQKGTQEWIKKDANSPTSQRKEATKQLEEFQMGLEEKAISATDLDKEKYAQRKAYNSFRNEEEFWRLKSRSLWLKAGDRNTTYFHRQYRARILRNHIAEITTSSG
eukprot:PITA_10020